MNIWEYSSIQLCQHPSGDKEPNVAFPANKTVKDQTNWLILTVFHMKMTRLSETRILKILNEHEAGIETRDLCL